ncbi:MAG: DNA primase [Planctomycetota bacterium]
MQDLEFRQLVQRVKEASPIEAIVGERVRLEKRGALQAARCPFHDEKTPSFYVDTRRQSWRCYGACADGGDVIKFVERFDGLSFFEALELLALSAGIDMPRNGPSTREQEDATRPLLDALQEASQLYREELRSPAGAAARAYLEERGFSAATIERFGLGWARDGGNPITQHARRASVPRAWLEAGLVNRGANGGGYDAFRARVMIPIADRLGRIVGFGGRILPGGERSATDPEREYPKYKNTSDTPVFHKRQLIFGWHLAADAIRRERHVVLVEGYTDVMAAHQLGLETVVAVLGTATTEEHARWIRRSGARCVTLVFDGDAAGRRAAKRAMAELLPTGLELQVASPPEGCDPGDLLLEADGRERFEAMLAAARPWFDWLVESPPGDASPGQAASALEPAEIAAAVDELLEILERLESPVELDAYLGRLADAFNLSLDSVRREAAARRRPARTQRAGPAVKSAATPAGGDRDDGNAPAERAYEHLLAALLADNSLIPAYRDLRKDCPAGDMARLFDVLLQAYDEDDVDPIDANHLWTCLADDPARERVGGLVDMAERAESPSLLARDQRTWLERRAADAALARLSGAIAGAITGETAPRAGASGLPQGAPGRDSAVADETELLRRLHDGLRARCVVSPGGGPPKGVSPGVSPRDVAPRGTPSPGTPPEGAGLAAGRATPDGSSEQHFEPAPKNQNGTA